MKSYLIIFHLVLLLFGFFFVEHHLDTPGRAAADREMLMSDGSGIAARIAAVGQINTAQAQSSTTTMQVAVTEAAVDGQKVYQSACIACHGAGVAGAPMVGNASVWADRIAAGNDSLYANAINGLVGSSGVMPANSGNTTLSDAEVKSAVNYMVSQSQ